MMAAALMVAAALLAAVGGAAATEVASAHVEHSAPRASAYVEFAYCTVCHGAAGNGNPVIGAPKIAGLEPWYLAGQLRAFRAGWRGVHPDDPRGLEMHFVATAIPDEETLARAVEFVGSLGPKAPPQTVKGSARRGAKLYEPCAACHGDGGQGNPSLEAPALANQSDWYLVAQLVGYRSGKRGTHPEDTLGAQMRAMTASLPDDSAIADVVAYLNSLRQRPFKGEEPK